MRLTEMGSSLTILGYFPYLDKGNFATWNKLKSNDEESNSIIDSIFLPVCVLCEG